MEAREASGTYDICEDPVLGVEVDLLHLTQNIEDCIGFVSRMILLHLEPGVVPTDRASRLSRQQGTRMNCHVERTLRISSMATAAV